MEYIHMAVYRWYWICKISIFIALWFFITVLLFGCAERGPVKPNVLENADAQNFDSDYQVAAELTNSATSSEPVDEDAGEIACPTNDYGNRRMLIYKGVEYMVIEPDVITIEPKPLAQ